MYAIDCIKKLLFIHPVIVVRSYISPVLYLHLSWQDASKKYLSITDNGPGAAMQEFKALYDESVLIAIKTGLGLHIIRDRAKVIKCQAFIVRKLKGTEITLDLY